MITFSASLETSWVDSQRLKPSPRSYNPSICEFNDRIWMAYRTHRMDIDGRCGIAICVLGPDGPEDNQWLNLGGATGSEHHEDPRLFIFKGKLHVSYSETTFPPGRPYIAVQKYARIERVKQKWKVAEVFRPKYGLNYAELMEKNWMFFESGGLLRAIYSDDIAHTVITLDGDTVIREHTTPAPRWAWGEIRGGTPPIPFNDGLITFFHSSTPVEEGVWRRYWMGAYIMDADEPFSIRAITERPLLGGNQDDKHGVDPRRPNSWKPHVVFPGGAVNIHHGWSVAVGVNDWRIAMTRISDLGAMVDPQAKPAATFIKVNNANRAMYALNADRSRYWAKWIRPAGSLSLGATPGFAKVESPRIACDLLQQTGVTQCSESEYASVLQQNKRKVKTLVT